MANYTKRPKNPGSKGRFVKKDILLVRILKYLFPWKGDGVAEIGRKLVFICALGAFAFFGGELLIDVGNEMLQKYVVAEQDRVMVELAAEGKLDISEEEYKEIIAEVPEILPQYMSIYAKNKDTVGWVTIGDTEVNYAVMQADDNDYYLTHNTNGDYSKGGAIFADYRNIFTASETSDNTILYGHNIWSGEYFAKVSRYYDSKVEGDPLAFYKENPTVTFDTIYEQSQWKVFACVLFNTNTKYGEVYDYTSKNSFASKDEFNNFILDIMDRSVLWTDVDLTYGDKILTLSTCFYPYEANGNKDTRSVVFARKVRPGESAEVDTSLAKRNYNPLCFQFQYDLIGGQWYGRTWDTSKLLSYSGE